MSNPMALAMAANTLAEAETNGSVEIFAGIELYKAAHLESEWRSLGKLYMQLSAAPFWIQTRNGELTPIHNSGDLLTFTNKHL